jgi:hypothetical protein
MRLHYCKSGRVSQNLVIVLVLNVFDDNSCVCILRKYVMLHSGLKCRNVNMLLHWKCKYKERFSFFWTSRFYIASKKSHLSVIFRNSFCSATAKLYFLKFSYIIWHTKFFHTFVFVSFYFSPSLTLLLDHDWFYSRKNYFYQLLLRCFT